MLLNMNDKLMLTNRDVKTIQGELAHINSKVHETNIKLDREAKIKDLVESLKMKITGLVARRLRMWFTMLCKDLLLEMPSPSKRIPCR